MNALQSYYASKTVTQKASVSVKPADGDTTTFTAAGRVTGKGDAAIIDSVRKHGIESVKDALKATDDTGAVRTNTVTLKGGTLKEQVSVALFLMGYADATDKPAKEKADKPSPATV